MLGRVRKRRRWSPDYERLATYNAECGRGIVHTKKYDEEMAVIQKRFDWDYRVAELWVEGANPR